MAHGTLTTHNTVQVRVLSQHCEARVRISIIPTVVWLQQYEIIVLGVAEQEAVALCSRAAVAPQHVAAQAAVALCYRAAGVPHHEKHSLQKHYVIEQQAYHTM